MINFEKSDYGLLVPEQPEPREKKPSRFATLANSVGLSTVVNFFMVLIQLATVWILWKTYQDTVIPNRQKELLSEQVAQLELEQAARSREVVLAKQRVQTVNRELSARRADLLQLSAERQNLLTEATTAQTRAERARLAEVVARSSASKAQSSLEASQWSVYYQSAGAVLMLPHMTMIRKLGELERAGIGESDQKSAFHTYLDGVAKIWPDMQNDARVIERELRSDDSKFYPRWMIDEFATYFAKESRNLSCPKPDFTSIRSDVDKKFDLAAAEAIAATKKEQAERQTSIDEAMKRRVEIPYPKSTKDYELQVAVSNATYKMIDEVEARLRTSIEECNNQFDPIGDRFFEARNATQQTIPSGVFRELNNNLSGEEQPPPTSPPQGPEE